MRFTTALRATVGIRRRLRCASSALADAELDGARARWQDGCARRATSTVTTSSASAIASRRRRPPSRFATARSSGSVIGPRAPPTDVPAADKNLDYYWTVDGLFDLIASAQARGVQVRAAYDAALGFPREVYIDYDADFIGDELDVRADRRHRRPAVTAAGRQESPLTPEVLSGLTAPEGRP